MAWEFQNYINTEMKGRCPITGRFFYRNIYNPDIDKLIPTYLNPQEGFLHSHTIPMLIPNGEGFVIQSFNFDKEEWQEPILLHTEQVLISLLTESKNNMEKLLPSDLAATSNIEHKTKVEEVKKTIAAIEYIEKLYE